MSQNQFAKAAEIIEGISDENLRRGNMDRLEILWTAEDPAAAKAWHERR